MEDLAPLLVGLIDGTQPLPPPHPQHLSFPLDRSAVRQLAAFARIVVRRSGRTVSDLEVRHLLFKVAAWCSRKGTVSEPALSEELPTLITPLQMVVCARPGWVTSRAGVGSALRIVAQWRHETDKLARKTYRDPPRVADIDSRGFYIVELTNGAHVHQEGTALGHCMATSINLDAFAKHGFPKGAAGLDCLTYAVKIRSGDLRIFSVRTPDGEPLFTISYDPQNEVLERMQGKRVSREQALGWGSLRCDALAALSRVVSVKTTFAAVACVLPRLRRPWCEKGLGLREETVMEAYQRHRATRAAREFVQARLQQLDARHRS